MRASVVWRRLATGAAITAALPGVVGSAYLTAIGRAARRADEPSGGSPSHRRFRILVPAHNEAAGIADTLRSLRRIDFPVDRFEVHVVADNCADETATIARRLGAIVHERNDRARPGKGPALTWAVDRLPPWSPDDVIVVIDADTVVVPDVLRRFDQAFRDELAAVQGNYRVRDDVDAGDVGFRAVAFAVRHVVRPAGRVALGGSSSLYGNGMAFREDIARSYRWSNTLTEDLEMGLTLLLDGHRVGFTAAAEVAAEMPETLDAAESQHARWESGRLDVARRFVPELIRAARERRHGRRWAYVDAALDISLLPLTQLLGVTVLSGGLFAVLARGRVRAGGVAASALSSGLLVRHVVSALEIAEVSETTRRSLRRAPMQMVWKARVLGRIAQRRPEAWVRTTRNDELRRSA